MALIFQPSTHQYFLDGAELKSVTTLLKELNLIDTRFITEGSGDVGRRRHKLLQLMDEGTLDWGSVFPEDLPYARAWANFCEEHQVTFDGIEILTYQEIYRYAGTIDRIGKFEGDPAIFDIKTGMRQKWHELQLLLYAMMVSYDGDKQPRLFDVYLKDTEKYQCVEADYKNLGVAQAVLRINNWKQS